MKNIEQCAKGFFHRRYITDLLNNQLIRFLFYKKIKIYDIIEHIIYSYVPNYAT